MRFRHRLLTVLCGAAFVLHGCGSSLSGLSSQPPANPAPINFATSFIAVPNVPVPVAPAPPGPSWSIDIGLVDAASGLYYLSDKTNCGVDVFDAKANTYLTTIGPATTPPVFASIGASCASIGSPFAGNTGESSSSGPNGIVLISSSKLYAGDGDGTLKVIDLQTRSVTGTIVIPTAKKRTDEGSYDPVDKVVLISSDSETAPLLTFINATTDTVIAQIVRSDATKGMESSVYVPQLRKFLQAVPATKANKNGEIDVIDPLSHVVTGVYPMASSCGPTGMALGKSNMVVACGSTSKTYVLDVGTGKVLAQINQAGGGDEAAYDASTNRYFVTNSNNTSNGVKGGPAAPVTTVIDASTMFFIQNIPTEAHAHSVATYNGKVFNPTPSHGISVFH